MFSEIAPRYDLLNRVMTGGLDTRWRRALARRAKPEAHSRILDIACGTGDIAFAFRDIAPLAPIIAADFALPMMEIGKSRSQGPGVHWCAADALSLPFADGSFDIVASGFLLRNVMDLPGCLREQTRVLSSGGRLLALDSAPPPPSLLRPLIRLYLSTGIPLLGKLLGGKSGAEAYRYLPESTLNFRTPQELARLFERAGLIQVQFRSFMWGTMTLIWGEKS